MVNLLCYTAMTVFCLTFFPPVATSMLLRFLWVVVALANAPNEEAETNDRAIVCLLADVLGHNWS